MKQTKLFTIAVYLLVLFGLGCVASASETEVITFDFETGDMIVQTIEFEDNEGTLITFDPKTNDLDIKVLEVTHEGN